MFILSGSLTLTIERAWQIQQEQVQHYSGLLASASQRAAFLAAVEQLNAGRTITTGWDVPSGVEIERLYYRAKGLTDADHAAFCAFLD